MRLATFAVIAVGIAAAFTGCGGASEEEEKAAVDARAMAERNRDIADKAATTAESCRSQLKGYISVLTETDSRLDVGMSFADYGSQVGDNSVEYDRIPFGKLESACVAGPGVATENAGNAYIKAYEAWNDCFGDIYCDMDSIDPELQKQWLRASAQIGLAKQELNALTVKAEQAEKAAVTQEELADEAEAALE